MRRLGFSLGELLVSLLIISVVLVAVMVTIPILLRGIYKVGEDNQAMQLARETLQQLRAAGVEELKLAGPTYLSDIAINGVVHKRHYAVSDSGLPRDPYNTDPNRNYLAYQVDVTVLWQSRNGSRQIKLSSQVGRSY